MRLQRWHSEHGAKGLIVFLESTSSFNNTLATRDVNNAAGIRKQLSNEMPKYQLSALFLFEFNNKERHGSPRNRLL